MILQRTCLKCAMMSHLRCIKMIVVILKVMSFMVAIKLVNSTKKMVNTFKINIKMVIKISMKENTKMKNITMIMAKKLFQMMKDITMKMIRIILMIAIIKGTIILTIIKTRLMKMKMSLTREKKAEFKTKQTVVIKRWQKIVDKDN